MYFLTLLSGKRAWVLGELLPAFTFPGAAELALRDTSLPHRAACPGPWSLGTAGEDREAAAHVGGGSGAMLMLQPDSWACGPRVLPGAARGLCREGGALELPPPTPLGFIWPCLMQICVGISDSW